MAFSTTIRKSTDPEFDADTITVDLGSNVTARVYAFPGSDDVSVVQIDTDDKFGQLRVYVNDGVIYEADPDELSGIDQAVKRLREAREELRQHNLAVEDVDTGEDAALVAELTGAVDILLDAVAALNS